MLLFVWTFAFSYEFDDVLSERMWWIPLVILSLQFHCLNKKQIMYGTFAISPFDLCKWGTAEFMTLGRELLLVYGRRLQGTQDDSSPWSLFMPGTFMSSFILPFSCTSAYATMEVAGWSKRVDAVDAPMRWVLKGPNQTSYSEIYLPGSSQWPFWVGYLFRGLSDFHLGNQKVTTGRSW